ncbi:alpha/beta fold hydrolase [Kocuria palustris]|uniref:alpha/beta fold hydrolase n=1 Tax=Kocuria palustris TaxID=71999 RepID=UPI00387A14FF
MNSKDLTVAALSSGTTDSATERYTIMRGSTGGGAEVPLGFLTSFMTYRHVPPQKMRIPVTLAHPARDAWTPVEISTRWLSRIAAPAELVMLRECGHFPIEDPGLADLVQAVERVARRAS